MATAILTLPKIMLARAEAAPSLGFTTIGYTNLTAVPRDESPALLFRTRRLARGIDKRVGCVQWVLTVYADVLVRNDLALDAVDVFIEKVADRMNPALGNFTAYGRGIVPDLTDVDIDEVPADATLIRARLNYTLRFWTAENSLTII